MPDLDDTCPRYLYRSGFEWKTSKNPPSDKHHTWYLEPDGTRGMVCTTAEAEKILLQRRLKAAQMVAEGQCEEEVRSNYDKELQQAQGPKAEAIRQWDAASKEVDE